MSEPPGIEQSERHTQPGAASGLEAAILRTVAYADIFDYPLTERELHRFLVGVSAPLSAVREARPPDHAAGRGGAEGDGAQVARGLSSRP